MPPENLPDDFSQLPTADGGSPTSPPANVPVKRQQTRIGPRTTGASSIPQESPLDLPAALTDDWNDLIQNTSLQASPASQSSGWSEESFPLSPESPPPAPPPPRRTVIGPRSAASVAAYETETPPVHDSEPPHEPQQATPPPLPPTTPPLSTESQSEKTEENHSQTHSTSSSDLPISKAPLTSKDVPPSSNSKTGSPSEAPTATETEKPAPASSPAPSEPSLWRGYWERWGGQALSLSIGIHVLILLAGATVVFTNVMTPQVDFLPGGGSQQGAAASQDLQHKIQQKKNPWLKKALPRQKIGVTNAMSDIVLPEDVPDLLDLPASKDFLSSSKLTGAMGLGGAGGGFNKAMGLGSQTGMVFQPFSMFGMQIKSKRLGLVLDVSTSMAPHLPRVIEEVDKVAKGSVVILYFGCGLTSPPSRGLDGDGIYSTSGVEFERFWRLGGATLEDARKLRIDSRKPIPSEDIYRMLARRSQTYFIHHVGVGYTWLALLNDKLRTADGIYWFSDFQDTVEFKQLLIVQENLERRKQRLYMHAYQRGPSFDLVKTQLVDTTRGDAIIEE